MPGSWEAFFIEGFDGERIDSVFHGVVGEDAPDDQQQAAAGGAVEGVHFQRPGSARRKQCNGSGTKQQCSQQQPAASLQKAATIERQVFHGFCPCYFFVGASSCFDSSRAKIG